MRGQVPTTWFKKLKKCRMQGWVWVVRPRLFLDWTVLECKMTQKQRPGTGLHLSAATLLHSRIHQIAGVACKAEGQMCCHWRLSSLSSIKLCWQLLHLRSYNFRGPLEMLVLTLNELAMPLLDTTPPKVVAHCTEARTLVELSPYRTK